MNTNKIRKKMSPNKRVVGFNILEDRCIWMKAGVINYRICDNAFDCNTCAFNKALRRGMKVDHAVDSRTVAPKWVAYLVERYDGANRPCRHALTGRIEAPKICPNNYECYHCAFDQMLDEMDLTEEIETPSCKEVGGYQIADEYYYHMGHCWARFEHGGRVRIGLDDFASCVFGKLDSVDLPPLGAGVEQDRAGWVFRRDANRAAVLSPVTGTLLAVNHAVREHPQLINEDPYGKGWLFILEPDLPKRNLKRLYFGKESHRWLESENSKLLGMMGPEYEGLSASGGSVVRDIFGAIEHLEWNPMVARFLHTKQVLSPSL